MRKPLVIAALSLALAVGSAGTGCVGIKSQRVMSAQDDASSSSAPGLRKVEQAEAEKLLETLSGEIQTVYPSDNGMARVFGQVANLGQTPYKQVRFDLVAKVTAESGDGTQNKVVGSFVIEDGLAPGDIEPFDVQTAASMGDVKNLVVMVSGLK